VERAFTARTRAILVVHTFGVPAEMDALTALAERRGLALIEDACEAVGARFDGRPVGSFGELAVLGFYPNKQMTTGEGGAVLVREPRHAARLRSLRNQGRDANAGWLDHAEIGYNYRLSELACALGRVQFERLDEMLASRAEAAARYDLLLGGVPGLELPALALPRRTLSWFVYAVRLPVGADRNRVQAVLAKQGIATGRYFPPIHRQPAWRNRVSADLALPATEAVAQRMLALPFYARITVEAQETVTEALRAALADS
jgi:perosamine synthetase